MIFNVGAGGSSTADKLKYDNSKSGLVADNVQGAIDEVSESLANGCVKFQVTTDGKLQYSVYTE